MIYSQCWKKNNSQPRILYLAKLYLKMKEKEIIWKPKKKKKAEILVTTKPALQGKLNEVFQVEMKGCC